MNCLHIPTTRLSIEVDHSAREEVKRTSGIVLGSIQKKINAILKLILSMSYI